MALDAGNCISHGILKHMATAPSEITEADILSEIIAPDQPTFSEASAREILALRFNQQAIERMNDLAERNRRGDLAETDRQLLERYQRVGNFLNLLQAKARLSLARTSNGS